MKYTCTLENLDCAHCAQKIEQKIADTDGFEAVSFNFATKTLRFESEKDDPLTEIQSICDSLEEGVTVVGDNKKAVESGNTVERIMLFSGIALGIAALILHLILRSHATDYIVLGLSAAATLLAGWKVFVKGLKNLIKFRIEETVLMMVAVIAAFILGEYVEGAMVTLLFTVGELIEDYAVDKSRRSIEQLSKIRPDSATLYLDGIEKTVPAESVRTGSVITVKPHERIPLDGIIIDGSSTIDNSALTGESLPQSVAEYSEVLSGGINGDGLLRIETTKEFSESTAARILRLVEDAAANKGKQEKFISRFASVYTPAVIGISLLIAVLPPLLGLGSFSQWIYNALVVLVASCPCAIVISVPLSYYSGIGAASKNGVLIKGGNYLEALAKADVFAFDKTGTLTKGDLTVSRVYTYGGYGEDEVLSLAAACEKYSVHPIAQAIKESAQAEIKGLSDYKEIAGRGTCAVFNGKKLACGNERLLSCPVPAELKDRPAVYLVYDGELVGAIELSDAVRDEAKGVISGLKKLGAQKAVMLTGDKKSAAHSVSKKIGIDSYYSELLPDQKLEKINAIKRDGHTVCFVGDGINDAPVLAASDCGAAMGLGSEAAIESSDIVLSSGNLTQLPKAVRIARATMRTIKGNIILALAVKAAVIILACFGLAAIWMSVVADTGVCVICVLIAARLLKYKT